MIAIRRENWVHALWLPLFVALFTPTLGFLWFHWTKNVWHNGHGMFVPLLVVFIARHALERESVKQEEPSVWGFAILGVSLFLTALDSAIKTELLSAAAFVLSLPGLTLVLLGPRRTRALIFPWLLCFFMLPIPAAFLGPIHMFLRQVTAVATAELLSLLGIPLFLSGTTIDLPHGPVQIVDECSGFSALYAAVTIAFVLIYMEPNLRRRVVLAIAPFPLAVLCNIVRVGGMVLIAHFFGYEVLDTWIHPFLGWLTFVATLALLFALASPRAAPRAHA